MAARSGCFGVWCPSEYVRQQFVAGHGAIGGFFDGDAVPRRYGPNTVNPLTHKGRRNVYGFRQFAIALEFRNRSFDRFGFHASHGSKAISETQ